MTSKFFLPELLAPAGNMERLEAAVLYGADAVYLGGRDELNLRHGAIGFSWDDLDKAIVLKKSAGVKLYYCINAFPRQSGFPKVEASLERLSDLDIDGLIIADPGVFRLARRLAPRHDIHVSTQANTASGEAALFWHEQGATRVNLARELDAIALRDTLIFLRDKAPRLESEVFVHGAMCLAISGQCLLSAWLNQRPGNLGRCTHPCRFQYKVTGINPDLQQSSLQLEESLRPGEPLWEVAQDNQGFSSFLSPHDLCLVKYLAWFCRLGVSALKIEGRMRTAPMVAQMVNVYRTALNDLVSGTFRYQTYLDELAPLSSRSLSSGFFLPNGKRKVFSVPRRNSGETPVVARLEYELEPGIWQVQVKSRWSSSNKAEILLPGLKTIECEAGSYFLENHKQMKADLLHPGTPARFYLPENSAAHQLTGELCPGLFVRSV